MPVDIDDLLAERREIPVEYGPFTVQIVYNPSSQTEEVEQLVDQAIKDERWSDSVRVYLIRVMKDWDLTSQGQPVPITEEGLKPVPTRLLTLILQAITKDIRGDEGEA